MGLFLEHRHVMATRHYGTFWGVKALILAEMAALGLPVPPGFTITTEVCTYYYDNDHSYPDALKSQVEAALTKIEAETGRKFTDADNPMLLSVRSGARASMPGMMDTVLNLGLNDASVAGLPMRVVMPALLMSYRRFIQMYGDVVLGVNHGLFEDALEEVKLSSGLFQDTELTAEQLANLTDSYKQIVMDETGAPFPQDPEEQLWGAVGAVFASWMNNRAITYRR